MAFPSSPVGTLGVAIDYALVEWFVVNVGGGFGLEGSQVAVSPRLRVSLGEGVGVGFETGLSWGAHREFSLSEDPDRRYAPVHNQLWMNYAGVFDSRRPEGLHFRLAFGLEDAVGDDEVVPMLVLGLGWSFERQDDATEDGSE